MGFVIYIGGISRYLEGEYTGGLRRRITEIQNCGVVLRGVLGWYKKGTWQRR